VERGLSNENISRLILFQHITANKVLFAVAAADVIVFKTAIRHRRLVLSLGCGSTAVTHIRRALNTAHIQPRGG